MGHCMDTNLATGHSSPRGKADCSHASPRLEKGQPSKHTDNRYAFAILHVHAMTYNERGLLTEKKKNLKTKKKVLALLKVVWLTEEMAASIARDIKQPTYLKLNKIGGQTRQPGKQQKCRGAPFCLAYCFS